MLKVGKSLNSPGQMGTHMKVRFIAKLAFQNMRVPDSTLLEELGVSMVSNSFGGISFYHGRISSLSIELGFIMPLPARFHQNCQVAFGHC